MMTKTDEVWGIASATYTTKQLTESEFKEMSDDEITEYARDDFEHIDGETLKDMIYYLANAILQIV